MPERSSVMKKKIKSSLYWLPVILYYGVIFVLSSLSADSIPVFFTGLDKFLHFLVYFGLGFLLFFAARKTFNTRYNTLLTMFFMLIFLALSDEIHQLFVPGRYFSCADIFFDCLGGLLGGSLYRWRK